MSATDWSVRAYPKRGNPGCIYSWAAVFHRRGGPAFWHPQKTWQAAMDYAIAEARAILKDRQDRQIEEENGWPRLAGIGKR